MMDINDVVSDRMNTKDGKMADAPWTDGWRIVCVRPDNLGDVLMTTPAFRALKETFPACHLTLVTSSAGATVAPMIPELDDTMVFDEPWVAS
ncbi:MAG: glycosyl transferase family protein, partial [Spirosoma sp.]|nr:glycosyl transferase family protein [Spirosoma sp.]